MATVRSLGATPNLLRQANSSIAGFSNISVGTRSHHAARHASTLALRTTLLRLQNGPHPAPRYFSQTAMTQAKASAKAKQAARAQLKQNKILKEHQEAEKAAEELEGTTFSDNNPNSPKNKAAARKNGNDDEAGDPNKPDPENPDNFQDVTSVWDRIDKYHVDKLKEVGGRFTDSVIGSVPVSLEKGTETLLRDLAVILPARGRTIQIRMHTPEYRQAIMSGIQASPLFNQQPQLDPDDEAVLLLKVEPERPEEQLKSLKSLCNGWKDQLRNVSSKRSQTHKDWKKSGAVLNDAVKKLDAELAKLQAKRMAAIDQQEKLAGQRIQKAASVI